MVFFLSLFACFHFTVLLFVLFSFFFRMLLIPFPRFCVVRAAFVEPIDQIVLFYSQMYTHTHLLAVLLDNTPKTLYAMRMRCFWVEKDFVFRFVNCVSPSFWDAHTHTQFDRRKRTLPTFAHSVAHYTSSRFKSIWVANLSLVTIFYTARLCVPRKYTRPWLAAGLGAPWAGLVSLLCFIQ